MIVSEETALKKKFFEYPDDPDKSMFEISVLGPAQKASIKSRTTKVVAKDGGGEMVFDTAAAGNLRAFAAMTGWENVFATKEDKAADRCMPFTAINKRKLLDGVPGMEEWVLEKLDELTQEYEAERESERKN